MQRRFAALSRRSSALEGHLDEQEVFADWAQLMCQRGVSQGVAVDQVVKQTHFLDRERKKFLVAESFANVDGAITSTAKEFELGRPALGMCPPRRLW